MPYVGRGKCQNCGGDVDVSLNVSGKAYYSHARCGFKVQFTTDKGSRKFLESVDRDREADELPAPAANPSDSPRNEPTETDTKPAAKPVPRGLGFWGGGRQ
ncbi:hypothetical protein [Burkholderia gladioli]|uniref:hypothetical protein n=1 Tax=Burkholderia gladioli TaxID=28095 RepID=UPI001642C9CF|nr:hypothetical protein [Burkholderia gladioli]